MELEHFCCLVVALSFMLPESDAQKNVADPPYCNLSRFAENFPVNKIPKKWLLQLSYLKDGSNANNKRNFCLEESAQSRIILRLCNRSEQRQFWFQYENSLINAKSGRSFDINNISSGAQSFTFVKWDTTVAKWNCEATNATHTKIKRKDRSTNLYFSADNSNAFILTRSSNIFWTFFDNNGTRIHSRNFCERRKGFCGAPKPGVNSHIISDLNWHSDFYNIPTALLHKALKIKRKICYSGGETVVYACLLGFHTPRNTSVTYQSSQCLGAGVWSLPKPMTCVRRMCGEPPSIIHAEWKSQVEKFYGVHAHYFCEEGYQGQDEILICGPLGTWMGDIINCTRTCLYVLHEPNGTIKSPNYPLAYPHLARCNWKIRAPQGLRVAIWIRDFFVEQGTVYPPHCRDDFLQFNETVNGVMELSQRFCGSNYPRTVVSKTNSIDVEFESDFDIVTKGFQMQYVFWNDSDSSSPPEPYFNFSDPDFLDDTYVFPYLETAHHFLEIFYGLVVGILLTLIAFITLRHVYVSYAYKVYPDSIDNATLKAQAQLPRRNAIAQHTESNLFDSMNRSSSILLVNDTSLLKTRSMAMVAKEIEEFREMTGQRQLFQNEANNYGISKTDITPMTMLSDMALDKYYADEEYSREWNSRINAATTDSEVKLLRTKMEVGRAHKHDDNLRDNRPTLSVLHSEMPSNVPELIVTSDYPNIRALRSESLASTNRMPGFSISSDSDNRDDHQGGSSTSTMKPSDIPKLFLPGL